MVLVRVLPTDVRVRAAALVAPTASHGNRPPCGVFRYSGVMSVCTRRTVAGCLLWVGLIAPLVAERQAQTRTTCRRPPIEPCTISHGRFSTQNGITQTIWLVGTTRRLHVTNEISDFLPANALKYTALTLPDHSYIFGDFTICPLEPDRPGFMRDVCVVAAKNLVVQNIDNAQRVFRIRSTWSDPATH